MDSLSLLNLLILGLATWRMSSLLVSEKGPFNIFVKIRSLTGIRHDSLGDAVEIPDNVFAQILSCVWCCSVWVGVGTLIIFVILPPFIYFCFALALSSISVIVQTIVGTQYN